MIGWMNAMYIRPINLQGYKVCLNLILLVLLVQLGRKWEIFLKFSTFSRGMEGTAK